MGDSRALALRYLRLAVWRSVGHLPPMFQIPSEDPPALRTSISVLGKYFDLPSLKVFCYLCYANRADWEERVKRARPLV